MKCAECHRTVHKRDRFCPNCGAPIRFRQHPAAKTVARPGMNWPALLAAVAFGILIGAFAMYSNSKKTPSAPSGFDPRLRGPQLASMFPQVYQVASQFNCPCGTCSDGLEVCDCDMPNGAVQVRQFIYDQLTMGGHLPPHVIEIVEQKWGHRKGTPTPDFSKLKPQ